MAITNAKIKKINDAFPVVKKAPLDLIGNSSRRKVIKTVSNIFLYSGFKFFVKNKTFKDWSSIKTYKVVNISRFNIPLLTKISR